MKSLKTALLFSFFGILFVLIMMPVCLKAVEPSKIIHHDLKVVLYPENHHISAQDTITFPESHLGEFQFLLHRGLNPFSPTSGVKIIGEKEQSEDVLFELFRVKLPPDLKTFVIKYNGNIYHPIEPYGKEQARGFKNTPGIISNEGVYLSGSSFWYPQFDEGMVTFNLEVELPSRWDAISQGERSFHEKEKDKTIVRWKSPEPQDEIFLVAGQFVEYTKTGQVTAMVFLRTPDKELSDKYLDATQRYISMYENLIGHYPYKKFALIENFWETGFGMPSFTLLGPKIIRFPFIINISYPHEILHNWWGNSVFPDPNSGNWSEGLTAYLSDHLIKEQQGNAKEYRQETLQKYADYVLGGRDFPLNEFRFRHSSPSEAIGYGKSLMFFHMLRQELGDKTFIAGLQDFYKGNKFNFASFNNLQRSFEKVSGKDLKIEFNQWIKHSGAPKLKLSNVKVKKEREEYVLTALVEQVQAEEAYHLKVPVAVRMEGQNKAYQTVAVMNKKRLELTIRLHSQPLRLDIDPDFDVFRRLDRNEIPPALSQALGAKKMIILLPSSANERLLKSYQEFAKVLSDSGPDTVEIKFDKEIQKLPSDYSVTILGWENHFAKEALSALSEYEAAIDESQIIIGNTRTQREKHSVVFTGWNPSNKDMAFILIATDIPEALLGLGRKLPHYHKYSYLVFEGDEPENVVKGRWPVLDSPMTAFLPDKDGKISRVEMGELAPREPLITLPKVFSTERMMETIRFLSSKELKGRGLGTKELDSAAEFISKKFHEAGLNPAGDEEGSYFQIWKDPENNITMKNVIGVIQGKKAEMSEQCVVIGAHYDHLGPFYPGADDNASGVAVLIELANVLSKNLNPDRSIVFVAFTGEEVGKKGSLYYVANKKRYPAEKCIGMVNLDTVGRLGKKKLLVLGAGSAKEWIHIFRGAGFVTGVEIEAVSERLDSSDNISFEEAGVPAVQLFSGPHLDYHRPTDTADKIDPDGLLKVASVTKEVVEYLASREEPLTATIKSVEKSEDTKKERKVSLGIIPDFSYSGEG
ncbi:MAG TPA: M20/M25/M40 family metallo-hydrolase, partial [Thermodesulfovibrionales bacterium]|nr:M20/M25/M40 family metallo-hydrolase [Thermodesulfovibrionales bacterium]